MDTQKNNQIKKLSVDEIKQLHIIFTNLITKYNNSKVYNVFDVLYTSNLQNKFKKIHEYIHDEGFNDKDTPELYLYGSINKLYYKLNKYKTPNESILNCVDDILLAFDNIKN